ncbi:MAG: T9SS type A sorting domain-containing protein [Deltaproteobacteria bacterium]
MNRIIIILSILFSITTNTFSQNVVLRTQADVDAFDTDINVINGNLEIDGIDSTDPITNLSHLSNVTTIKGNLKIINNTLLKNIDQLYNVTSVKGEILLRGNAKLENLNGFSQLKSVSTDLGISNNPSLINIDGLSQIKSVGKQLYVVNNQTLANINGLSGITYFTNRLHIGSNNKLTDITGLSGLTSLEGILEIDHNPALINIDGLGGLKTVTGELEIHNNYALTNIDGLKGLKTVTGELKIYVNALKNLGGLSGLTSIEGYILIHSNSLINLDDLKGITSVAGELYIGDERELANIDGLSGITSVTGTIELENIPISNLNGLKSLTSLEGKILISWIKNLHNVDDLSGLTSIAGRLKISYNHALTNIDGFNGIKTITGTLEIINNDALTNIDGLSGLKTIEGKLDIYGNTALTNLNGLSNLTSVSGVLTIEANHSITNIDGLFRIKSISGVLKIYGMGLSNLNGLKGINSVSGSLTISSIWTLTNLDDLSGITSVTGSLNLYGNDKLININGLSGITSHVGNLYISNNNSLINVDGLSGMNSIGTLYICENKELSNLNGLSGIKYVINKLEIWSNPALTNCCGIQFLIYKYGLNSGILNVLNNSTECSSAEEIKNSRCYDYDYVEGKVNFYSDSGGCDSTDVSIPNIKIRVFQNSNNDYVISDKYGSYRYFLREPGLTILFPEYDNKLFKIEPDTVIINYPSDSLNLVHDFCVTPVKKFNDLEITIIPLTQARPGFEAAYEIIYKNKGTSITSDKIEFYYYDNLVTFIKADPPADSIYKNTIRWQYNDLMPFDQRKIVVKFKLNKPTDNPPLNGGELLTYAAKIYPVEEYNLQVDNSFRLNQIVVNSLDPNDKTCLDGNEFDIQNVGDYVNYLIRFENKGTAEAVNIKVVDVIDTSLFDISTLEITSSSHSCFTNIYKDTVEFLFEHIFLDFPDDENDGFISFKIKTRPTLESGTILKNTANIYFDYNLPVKTNIATTIVKEIVATKETDTGSWQIFPNPSAGSFYIGTDLPGNYSVTLYDTYGKAVYTLTKEIRNLTELQFYNLPSGLYFLKFEDKGKLYYNEKIQIFK